MPKAAFAWKRKTGSLPFGHRPSVLVSLVHKPTSHEWIAAFCKLFKDIHPGFKIPAGVCHRPSSSRHFQSLSTAFQRGAGEVAAGNPWARRHCRFHSARAAVNWSANIGCSLAEPKEFQKSSRLLPGGALRPQSAVSIIDVHVRMVLALKWWKAPDQANKDITNLCTNAMRVPKCCAAKRILRHRRWMLSLTISASTQELGRDKLYWMPSSVKVSAGTPTKSFFLRTLATRCGLVAKLANLSGWSSKPRIASACAPAVMALMTTSKLWQPCFHMVRSSK